MTSLIEEKSSVRAVPGWRRLSLLWMAAALGVVLHNAEEWWLSLTVWVSERPWLPGHALHGDPHGFALVLAIVTGAVLAIAITALALQPAWSAEVLACVSWALIVNAVGHLILSVLAWSPMPGVITGVGLLIPLGLVTLRKLPPVQWTATTVVMAVMVALGITAGAFVLGAAVDRIV